MRISDLIERAGGTTEFAYRTGAQFFRREKTTITRYKDTIVTVRKNNLKSSGDSTIITLNDPNNDVVSQNESKSDNRLGTRSFELVKETVRLQFEIDTIVTRMVDIDLNDVKRNKNSRYNYVLNPNDRLIIPPIDDIVTIKGAIRNRVNDTTIVNTAYIGDKNAKWYIDNYAGSFGKDAWKRSTQVVYPSGRSVGTKKFLWFNRYPDVTPGSEVIVEYKPPREEKARFFEDLTADKTLTILGSIASTAILIGLIRR